MAKKTEYHEGKAMAFARIISGMIKRNPSLADDFDYLRAQLIIDIPELKDKTTCPNCQASMREHVYTLDILDAVLLVSMANHIRINTMNPDFSFTEANQVKINDLDVPQQIKSRAIHAAKLGLIAPFKSRIVGKNLAGIWVVTRRGWYALRGNAIPAKVKVWRNTINERFDDLTTLYRVFQRHIEKNNRAEYLNIAIKKDYRIQARAYNPVHWEQFSSDQLESF